MLSREGFTQTLVSALSLAICIDLTWVTQVFTLLLQGIVEVSRGVAFVGFRTSFIPKLPNIVSVILRFCSTGTHEEKCLIHSLWNLEGSGEQNGSCQTLWPVADLSLSKQIMYNPWYNICDWTMMGCSILFYLRFHIMLKVLVRNHKVTLNWKFLKSWRFLIFSHKLNLPGYFVIIESTAHTEFRAFLVC